MVLAPALRRRPALETLSLQGNPFGNEGLAVLVVVAPPPADATPPQAEALAQLNWLNLSDTQITNDGCAHLVSSLRNGALPALHTVDLDDTPTSPAARAAVDKALFTTTPMTPTA